MPHFISRRSPLRLRHRAIALFLITLLLVCGWDAVEGRSLARPVEADVSQPEVTTSPTAIAPQTISGRLDQNSDTLDDGSYYNVHTFTGVAGQAVAIELTSDEFDTYLSLRDQAGNEIAVNDDSNGTNSRIAIALPETGMYTIIAKSYAAQETGSYNLMIRAATENDLALTEATRLEQQVLQLYQRGQFTEAIPLAQQVLEVRERILGNNHFEVAAALSNLGLVYQAQGDYAAAEPLFQRSLSVLEATLGTEHPNVGTRFEKLL